VESLRKMPAINLERLAELAKPIKEYLESSHNPHCAMTINSEGVSVIETTAFAPHEKSTI